MPIPRRYKETSLFKKNAISGAILAAKAEITVTTEGIASEVSKITSAKYVTTGYNYTLTQIKTYAAEGYSGTWTIASTPDIRVGDTIYLKVQDTTRICPVYIKTTVNIVNSATSIKCTSHGYEDILPVDTIKSTINQSSDSVKIAANHVDIEGAAIFSGNGRLSQTSLNNTYDSKGSASAVNTTLSNYMTSTNSTLQSIQNQVDGQIEAWYFETDPADTDYAATATPTDSAASTWTTAALKDRHVGDLYYNVNSGHSWRWMKNESNSTYKWLAIPDSDAAAALAAVVQSRHWYAVCSTAAGIATKEATIDPATTEFTNSILTPGTIVLVKFTNENSAAVGDLKLSVNSTTAKNIKYIYNGSYTDIPAANYIKANQMYTFTYDGTYWIVEMNYNTDTKYNMAQVLYNQAVKARQQDSSHTGYVGTHLIVGTADGYVNLAAGSIFDLAYPILYYATANTTTIAAGSTANNHYLEINNLNYSINGIIESGAANKVLYLKGTISGNQFTVATAPFMTTVIPITTDNYVYIPLGLMSSATNGRFSSTSNLYAYLDGAFRQITPTEVISEQYIYIQAVSGTNNISGTTIWVTSTAECVTGTPPNAATSQTPAWSTKHPTYQTNYPITFIAKQTKRLDGTVVCTTPVKDDSMTIIDGGHITTGTIDASIVNVNNINASNISTGTIDAERIKIADFTNYCQLNTNTASKYGWTVTDDSSNPNTSWFVRNTLARDNYPSQWFNCMGGESFKVAMEVSSTVTGATTQDGDGGTYMPICIGINAQTSTGENSWRIYSIATSSSSGTVTYGEGVITIPDNAVRFRAFIQIAGWPPFIGTLKVRKCVISKMANGKLIVDGSITTDKIDANAVTASKISVEVNSAISTASTTATNYISMDSTNGLKIAQSNPSSATTNYVQIKSDGIYTYKDSTHFSLVKNDGFHIYSGDSTNDAAFFGTTARIGLATSTNKNIYVSSSGISFRTGITEHAAFNLVNNDIPVLWFDNQYITINGSHSTISNNFNVDTLNLQVHGTNNGRYAAINMNVYGRDDQNSFLHMHNDVIDLNGTYINIYGTLQTDNIIPNSTNTNLGNIARPWATIYAASFVGDVTGNCSGSSGSCTGNAVNVTGTVAIGNGGTGSTTASAAWTALGGGSIGKKNSLAASDIPNLSATKITSGTLPISYGGTGSTKTTTTTSDVISAATNTSIGVQSISVWGKVATLYFKVTTSAAISASVKIAEIATGYRPATQVFLAGSNSSYMGWAQSDGGIYTRVALTANTNYYFQATYVIA